MKKFLSKYRHDIILGILIFIYIVYFTTASFLRYDNFYTGRYDLGNMDQTIWNTINGRIFQTSGDNGQIISRLSAHADFILILLSPFYFLWSNPKMLLLIQTIVLALGAVFVYLIAKELIKNKHLSLVFGFLFLMNPSLQYANLYDFHAVTLATTFLLASFYFLVKKRYFLLVLFLILSGITKEQVWIITSIFGFFLLFKKAVRMKFLGSLITVISLFLFYYFVSVVIPQNAGGQHFALTYYSDFGDSPISVILNILLSPRKLFLTIFDASGIDYLLKMFIPLGFISLLNPFAIMFSAPDLLINLLSNNPNLRQIYYQYTSTLTPFIFISGIYGVKQFVKWFPKVSKSYLIVYLLFFTFYSAYSFGPLPGAKNPNVDMFTKPYTNKRTVEDFLLTIPEKYSVAATNNLGSHLSHRETIYTIPIGIDKADIVAFLLNDRFAQPSLNAQIKMAQDLKSDKNYVKIFEQGDFIVFKKRGILL
jgi:uncharacterized membrane protein